MLNNKEYIEEFQQLLLSLNRIKLEEFINKVKKSYSIQNIINKIVFPTLQNIGKLWSEGTIALSQVYMSGKRCKDIIDALIPEESIEKKGLPNIGLCNLEDHHPLGMQIISSYLRAYGIYPIEYRIGITVNEILKKIVEDKIRILLISTLMIRSVYKIKDLIQKIEDKGIEIDIIVGGAPFLFDPQLYKRVGADHMGTNAFESLDIIKNLSKEEI
jgi:methanogenic corrinoid protein MtbC1